MSDTSSTPVMPPGNHDSTETRRAFLNRAGLLAGIGLVPMLAGCTRGDEDEDNDGAEPGVPEDSGLEEGAEDPGEEQGVATETGIDEETVDSGTEEDEGVEEEGD